MRRNIASLILILLFAAPAQAQLFESDSKRFGEGKMDIVVKEIDRRPRSSVLQIDIKAIGSSVGSSFFLLCSIRQLARLRGNFRYIVKLEEQPKPGQMIVGFLREANEDPTVLGSEFKAVGKTESALDLDQFAPICDGMK
ncbi:MAG: hypothetical protein EXR70_14025 [Deltaproteobacteria bacterium]|nr:hypothetical protein [Deltaproteobacteria bacterium]